MGEMDWGHERPVGPDTGIFELLHAYATQGGHLFGARRSAENPLTLTHVRWQSPTGTILEAVRSPDSGDLGSTEERDVWVQLALQLPQSLRQMGPEAPWLPFSVSQQQAMIWVRMGRQSQTSWPARGAGPSSWGPSASPYPPPVPTPPGGLSGAASLPPIQRMPGSPPGESTPPGGWGTTPPRPSPYGREPGPYGPIGQPSPYSQPLQRSGDAGQWTNSWQRGETAEVVVLPCVEVELPPLLPGRATADYRRDFSRDVAMHFGRAARSIPQVREVRGWMRGDRLVLAARFAVASGSRPATRPEMDAAARTLAEALAQRTLPYAALGFADPAEWIQGAALPE